MMLDKIQRQNRCVEQLAKNAMTGNAKDVSDWPGHDGDDAMGVSIGDEIHNHYHPESSPPKPPSPEQLSPEDKLRVSKWGKWTAILTAIAAGPLGAAGGYYLANRPEEPPAVEIPVAPPVVEFPATPASEWYLRPGFEVHPPEG